MHSPIGYPLLEQKKANIGFWSLVVDEEVDDEYAEIRSAESDEFQIDEEQVASDLADEIAAALLQEDWV